MIYTSIVRLRRDEFERINRLLAIDSLEEMSEEELENADAKTDSEEGVFFASFADGSYMTYDLCSGKSNYYDDVVLMDGKGFEHVIDCQYELDCVYEVEIGKNVYRVEIELGE